MPSSFTVNKGLEQPAAGSYNNTWATPVNADWAAIDNAFGGMTTIDITGVPSGTYTLSLSQYQTPNIWFTGTLTSTLNYIVPGAGGIWTLFNNTSGSIRFGTGGGGGVAVPAGQRVIVVGDGTNMQFADSNSLALAEVYAQSVANTAQANAEAYALTQSTAAQNNAETFATSAANTAQSNAEAYAAALPFAPLASPALTGNPTAPTQSVGNNSTRLSNTAFVQAAIAAVVSGGTNGSVRVGTLLINFGQFTAPGSSPAVISYTTAFSSKVFAVFPFCISSFQEVDVQAGYFTSLANFTVNFAVPGALIGWLAVGV